MIRPGKILNPAPWENRTAMKLGTTATDSLDRDVKINNKPRKANKSTNVVLGPRNLLMVGARKPLAASVIK